jgi:hypothetical protein
VVVAIQVVGGLGQPMVLAGQQEVFSVAFA